MSGTGQILTINCGSSSLKFALFELDQNLKKIFEGAVENIGAREGDFFVKDGEAEYASKVTVADHHAAMALIREWIKSQPGGTQPDVIVHRIVHGGPDYHQPVFLDSRVLADLEKIIPLDPLHLPVQLSLIKMTSDLFGNTRQAACFDTDFHHDLPDEARLLALPRRYQTGGLRRYGFHGLSCQSILDELTRIGGERLAGGRLIVAHLGNGVSLSAILDGKSIDTTMSLTPASGLPMSTRAGDLDPGLGLYFSKTEGQDNAAFDHMVNFESGLLGLSETSADMKRLLELEPDDERARQAVGLFCYQLKKAIGGLSAALGGLDRLVFTGGMGENAPKIRVRACTGLDYLGIKLETDANESASPVISTADGRVEVRIIHADEAGQMAKQIGQLMKGGQNDAPWQQTPQPAAA